MAETSVSLRSKSRLRRLLIVLMTLIAIYLLVPLLLPWMETWGDHKAKLERIQRGMTLKEAETILGGPAGNYSSRTYSARTHSTYEAKLVNDPGDEFFYWNFDSGTAEVGTHARVVISTGWYEHETRSFKEYMRDFLKWLGI
jgi:hypothetical protein